MERTNPNYALTSAFVEALARLGLEHVCITPGSRNSPLAFPFAAHPGITDWVHLDERSAAFFALGLAVSTRRPVAVVTTSGTAAAELHPAAVEARLSRVPLLLLTADRPPELRDVGAPQAIDQVGMFGTSVKWFHEAATLGPAPERYPASLAGRAWASALDAPSGPVHLNFPFREPLAPIMAADTSTVPVYSGSPPHYGAGRLEPEGDLIAELAELISGRRCLIVAGPLDRAAFPVAAAGLAAAGDFPIVADPLSQLRAGPHDRARVVTTGDTLARTGRLDHDLRPDAVIRFGAAPTSKALMSWLADHSEVPQFLVDEAGWRDPGGGAHTMVRSDPVSFASQLAAELRPGPEGWLSAWTEADQSTRAALGSTIRFPSEPAVATELAAALPSDSTLYVGSSMPVRDIDTFFPSIDRSVRILSNRGANGIDGVISSGLGATAAGESVVVLTGDLAALHDLTALGAASRLELPITVTVVNNDGGGIFHFLPQAAFPKHFERLLGTPHGTDFRAAAGLFGFEYELVEEADRFRELIGRPPDRRLLLEIRTDRSANVRIHREAWDSAAAVRPPPTD